MPDIVGGRREAALVALAVFVIVGALYAATFSFRSITDSDLNSLQTRSLVLHGDVDLARYQLDLKRFTGKGGNLIIERSGHQYSVYGVGVSLVAAPIYAVLDRTGTSERARQGAVAVFFSAASVAVLALVLLKLFPRPVAIGGIIAFAFGTTVWPVASTALFQQGAVLLFESIGLLGVFSWGRNGPALGGLGFGAAVLVRPTTAIPLVIVGLLYLGGGWRRLARYGFGALLPIVVLVVQTRWIWGSWVKGGYSHLGVPFDAPFGEALGGLSIGWWRGLFVYSPILVLGVVGWVLALRRFARDPERTLSFLGISTLLTILLYSAWADWGGGINQFGYRLQLEVVPFLVLLGAYAVTRIPRLSVVAVPLAALSVLTMTWGAAPNRIGWDDRLFARAIGDTSIGRAWSNFFNHPGDGLLRLAGVALCCGLIVAVTRGVWKAQPRPAFAPSTDE